jgi:putative hydrolase of the HAD superfamily
MSARARISTLFTDIGGVLLTNGWDRQARKRAAEHFHLDHEELNERHHLTYDTYESGKLSLEEYLRRIVFYEPREFTVATFRDFMFEQSQALPGMIEFVKQVKSVHGLKVAVVSNEGREVMEHRIRRFDLGSFVDFFIGSCFVHARKPDLDIYRMALDTAQVRPEHGVYIDDRLMFVEVARSLGLQGIHHRSVETTRAALAAIGLPAPD